MHAQLLFHASVVPHLLTGQLQLILLVEKGYVHKYMLLWIGFPVSAIWLFSSLFHTMGDLLNLRSRPLDSLLNKCVTGFSATPSIKLDYQLALYQSTAILILRPQINVCCYNIVV